MKNLLFVLFLLGIPSCISKDIEHPNNRNNKQFPYKGDGTEIDIYLVKPDVAAATKQPGEIGNNDLEPLPWLSHSEIEFFDWSAKAFYLKNEKSKNSLAGRCFVVMANKKTLFTGFFYSGYMSFIPQGAIIIADDWRLTPKKIVVLQELWIMDSEKSSINSLGFRQTMEKTGLLKEGISVELTSINKKKSTTLSYSFKVTNLDTEDIYVLDPAKMGSSRFHYFTNGPNIKQGNTYFGPTNFDFTPSDKIEMDWLIGLTPRQSMSRTVQQSGYKDLPDGKIIASFVFPGVLLTDKDQWKMNNGRIWFGSFTTEKELTLR